LTTLKNRNSLVALQTAQTGDGSQLMFTTESAPISSHQHRTTAARIVVHLCGPSPRVRVWSAAAVTRTNHGKILRIVRTLRIIHHGQETITDDNRCQSMSIKKHNTLAKRLACNGLQWLATGSYVSQLRQSPVKRQLSFLFCRVLSSSIKFESPLHLEAGAAEQWFWPVAIGITTPGSAKAVRMRPDS
jgi:hypothetical protein